MMELDKLSAAMGVEVNEVRQRRLVAEIAPADVITAGRTANEHGFTHLSAISATDWPEDGVVVLTYHLWSYADKQLLTLKTKIGRDDPHIDSVVPIWHENAQIHERELHELFGIDFIGNPDLAPLFLEDWEGPPPFRKDFNWREYVQDKFFDKENVRERGYYG